MKVTKRQWGRLRQGAYVLADGIVGALLIYGVVDGQQSAAFLVIANAALTMAFFKVDLGDKPKVPYYGDTDLNAG